MHLAILSVISVFAAAVIGAPAGEPWPPDLGPRYATSEYFDYSGITQTQQTVLRKVYQQLRWETLRNLPQDYVLSEVRSNLNQRFQAEIDAVRERFSGGIRTPEHLLRVKLKREEILLESITKDEAGAKTKGAAESYAEEAEETRQRIAELKQKIEVEVKKRLGREETAPNPTEPTEAEGDNSRAAADAAFESVDKNEMSSEASTLAEQAGNFIGDQVGPSLQGFGDLFQDAAQKAPEAAIGLTGLLGALGTENYGFSHS